MKDNFSSVASGYAIFRPTYPEALYRYLFTLVNQYNAAWDCATGNGQVARVLAGHFKEVYATDISENQLSKAPKIKNVTYRLEQAEKSAANSHSFDLVTVSQAIHWFDFDAFYAEVKRTLKPEGVFAVLGYGNIQIDAALDKVIYELYEGILGKYWDDERRYIEEAYQTIPFPFKEEETPEFKINTPWSFEQLTGYMSTWSSVQHYKKANNQDPLQLVAGELAQAWGNEKEKTVNFPVLLRVGK